MTKPAKTAWRERRQTLWPVLLAAVLTWESVTAVPSVGPAWLSFDKLAHFMVFGLLATTIARLELTKRWKLLGPLWAIVLVSIYGMGTEFLQSLTPDRSMEYGDWVADTLGAAVAVVAYLEWKWYRSWLELPVRPRRPQSPAGPQLLTPEGAAAADPRDDHPRVEISHKAVPNPPE